MDVSCKQASVRNQKVCQQTQETSRNTAFGDSTAQTESKLDKRTSSYQNGGKVIGGGWGVRRVSWLSIQEIVLISSGVSELDTQCLIELSSRDQLKATFSLLKW